MHRRFLSVPCLLFAALAAASAQQVDWTDPSPHNATFVAVEDGVRLEVLDWGGSGRPLVLLAGLGDTAHVFDDIAPTLAKRYRVLGVTRRAHGRSSAPAAGYTPARLAEDVVRVLEATGVKTAVIVGHSFAGEEMHVLGSRYSEQIAGLVYLDAAFNRADGSEDYDAAARTLPPAPRPAPADLQSFTALRAFLTKTQGQAGPDAHLRARWVANADGTVARPWVPDLPVRQAFSSEMQAMAKAYNPERIRVPALAIYAVPKSADDLNRPWYDANDPAVRERVQTLHRLARERFARHAKWFAGFADRGGVAEISGTHHLFISNPREVLEQIDAFVSSLSASAVRHRSRNPVQLTTTLMGGTVVSSRLFTRNFLPSRLGM
jgi:pimeloyl-ACP methyl ester carboxylesterase